MVIPPSKVLFPYINAAHHIQNGILTKRPRSIRVHTCHIPTRPLSVPEFTGVEIFTHRFGGATRRRIRSDVGNYTGNSDEFDVSGKNRRAHVSTTILTKNNRMYKLDKKNGVRVLSGPTRL